MANRTDVQARNVHGTNPQYLVEKILRAKIYDCRYWKEFCFGLSGTLKMLKFQNCFWHFVMFSLSRCS
jgi:hypothetical protein